MREIEFSVMEDAEGEANNLLPLLKAFEEQYSIRVKLTGISWYKGWTDIAKFGIFGHGPDVSCVGQSWIGSLAAMHALRPFDPQQIRALGGADAFFESSWRSGFLPNDPTAWAVPWLGDAMVIYYWKDAVEKAGIHDVHAAFATDDALVETLKKLQASGYPYPLALTTKNISMILHEAVHWVWNSGGALMDENNQEVIFNKPAALKGFKKYFSLRPFVSPQTLTDPKAGDFFRDREAAVHFAGPWMGIVGRQTYPEWDDRLGVVAAPGTAYVGGASFVIWQYSTNSQEAFELVRFLSSQPTCIPASPHSIELPTRRDAIHMPSAETDIFHRTYLQALQNGRSFPTIRLWGSIEDKLIAETSKIWEELFTDPDQDLDECLHRHLDPLAERLNVVLGN
jgi:ABC-type glycerol-3-phosphate transport system substrate-binding protein